MITIGTSGYAYPDWQGRFYPNEVPPSRWLEYYSRHFPAVEINLTFFRLPASPVFRHWRRRTPKEFQFMLKGSRQISHQKRFEDCHQELADFFERASELKEKWAGVLWQLPPRFSHDLELLRDFLAELDRVQVVFGKIRQAFEFHDPSWFEEPVYALLRDFKAALVVADRPFDIRLENQLSTPKSQRVSVETSRKKLETSALLPATDHDRRTHHQLHHHFVVPKTADFFYLRRYGPDAKASSPYEEDQLCDLATELESLPSASDVYLFFTNHAQGYAIGNVQHLKKILAQEK